MRNRGAVLGVAVLALLVLFAVLGSLFTPYTYTDVDFADLTTPPSPGHPFGTNAAGNDTYAQAVHGLQRSLVIALSVSLLTTAVAAVVGAAAAYLGGRTEKIILEVIHFLLVVPSFLILALVSQRAHGEWASVGPRADPSSGGCSAPAWLLVVSFTLGVVAAVQSETALSFIGFGVQQPDVSLGTMLSDGANTVSSAPWLFFVPAALVTLLTVSMALIGDGLRDALDPTSRSAGRA